VKIPSRHSCPVPTLDSARAHGDRSVCDRHSRPYHAEAWAADPKFLRAQKQVGRFSTRRQRSTRRPRCGTMNGTKRGGLKHPPADAGGSPGVMARERPGERRASARWCFEALLSVGIRSLVVAGWPGALPFAKAPDWALEIQTGASACRSAASACRSAPATLPRVYRSVFMDFVRRGFARTNARSLGGTISGD